MELLINAFIGLRQPPSSEELDEALGQRVHAVWDSLLEQLSADGIVNGSDWHSNSLRSGWSLQLRRGTRAIVYLSPSPGAFTANFALNRRAVSRALDAGLSDTANKALSGPRDHFEGTQLRLDVRIPGDLSDVRTLAGIKAAS